MTNYKQLGQEQRYVIDRLLKQGKSRTEIADIIGYHKSENGNDFVYQISYEFREDGMPTKRFATSGGSTQITKYEYY